MIYQWNCLTHTLEALNRAAGYNKLELTQKCAYSYAKAVHLSNPASIGVKFIKTNATEENDQSLVQCCQCHKQTTYRRQ